MINYFFFESRQQSEKINFSTNFYEVSRRNILDIVLKEFLVGGIVGSHVNILKNSIIQIFYYFTKKNT